MTNEFKIKKGLVVTGSGGTLLDVQGSVGQLFSVTDSLTGDLFSVSDVSGIPIFNVNASGLVTVDGDQTVDGHIKMITGNSTGKFAVLSTGVHSSYDFYNDGTSYLNGAVTVDAAFTQTGAAASTFSGTLAATHLSVASTTAADIPLILGSSNQTNYTLQQWQTSSHAANEAYILAYGADHTSQAGNFAMKNIESGGEIFFELAAGVEPLRLTSTGSTFAGAISTPTGSTFAGAIKITETGTAQHILIGNQDSGGTDKPAMIQGVNGQLNLGFGSSWSSEGGTMTDTLSLDVSNNAVFAGTVTAPQHFKASGNNISFSAGAVQVLNIDLNRKIYPSTDNSTDLGFSSTQNRFRHGYFTGSMYVGDNLVMTGEHPTLSFIDTNTNADDFYIHINSNNFYILTNRTDSPPDQVDTGWETPHPLQLEADTNTAYVFGNEILDTSTTFAGDVTGTAGAMVVGNDSHTHDSRYYTETEIDANHYGKVATDAKFLTKDGSAKEWVFEVNDESNISGNKWYKIATVNKGNGGLHIRGLFSNHVEGFASQKVDIGMVGREGGANDTLEVTGTVDVLHRAATGSDNCGIRIVEADITSSAHYHYFDVYVKTTRYQMLRLHLTKSGATTFHTSPTVVTTEPAPVSGGTTGLEIDTSTYAEGNYLISNSAPVLTATTAGTSVVGSLTAAADVIAYSDEKLKENVKTLDGSKVLQMRGVSFDRLDNGKYSSGVIAQELEKVAPELVIDDGKYKGVAYGNITGYLIEAIKEQQKQINELKSQMTTCNKTNCNCNCKN